MGYKKKYKEALERAREFQKSKDGLCVLTAESIFPELQESEDERIRKTLLESFEYQIKESYPDKEWICGVKLKEIVAWLEKQGEQKATDKVEPKFHEGDWIIDKQGIVHQIEKVIENVTNNTFAYDLVGGGYFNEEVKSCRLWTIDDAKDGDVLYSLDSKQPFIFKHRKPNEQAAVYCGINTYGKFFIGNTKDCVITTDKYIPADKFQRDLLFKKIEEAGYEWDDDKKELKLLISNGGDFESPTWSEDDERLLKATINTVLISRNSCEEDDEVKDRFDDELRWLKSLKERLS